MLLGGVPAAGMINSRQGATSGSDGFAPVLPWAGTGRRDFLLGGPRLKKEKKKKKKSKEEKKKAHSSKKDSRLASSRYDRGTSWTCNHFKFSVCLLASQVSLLQFLFFLLSLLFLECVKVQMKGEPFMIDSSPLAALRSV